MIDYDELMKKLKESKPQINKNTIDKKEINHYVDKVRRTLLQLKLNDDNLDNNLSNIQIEKIDAPTDKIKYKLDDGSKNMSSVYDNKHNRLSISSLNDIIHELFHISSSNRETSGIILNREFYAMNEGITDMLTNMTDSNYLIKYPMEEACASIFILLFGNEILEGYTKHSFDIFINKIPFKSRAIVINFLRKLDEFENLYLKYLNEQKLPNSLFGLFENLITTLFRLCYKDNQKMDQVEQLLKSKFNSFAFSILFDKMDLKNFDCEYYKNSQSYQR
ncbi:MAG: hypothetical protein PUA90_03665 [bacterium]|nr:hypothetical protein [bacterium]